MALNVAKLIAQQFAKNGKAVGVQGCTLIKRTPGTRAPGAASAGTNPIEQSYKATGLVSDYKAYQIDGTLIRAGDRQVLLFGASIESGAVPEPGDSVTIDGETLTIVKDGVKRDPAKASYQCQCRK